MLLNVHVKLQAHLFNSIDNFWFGCLSFNCTKYMYLHYESITLCVPSCAFPIQLKRVTHWCEYVWRYSITCNTRQIKKKNLLNIPSTSSTFYHLNTNCLKMVNMLLKFVDLHFAVSQIFTFVKESLSRYFFSRLHANGIVCKTLFQTFCRPIHVRCNPIHVSYSNYSGSTLSLSPFWSWIVCSFVLMFVAIVVLVIGLMFAFVSTVVCFIHSGCTGCSRWIRVHHDNKWMLNCSSCCCLVFLIKCAHEYFCHPFNSLAIFAHAFHVFALGTALYWICNFDNNFNWTKIIQNELICCKWYFSAGLSVFWNN